MQEYLEEEVQAVQPLRNAHRRGALENPTGRFESIEVVYDPDEVPSDDEPERIKTQYFRDGSKSVVTTNDSPDVGFSVSVNPYRGCEHGCIYCFARPTHEYLGLSAGLDFESKIFVKMDAPALLRKTLSSKSWKPQSIVMSGVTDCYQPVERKLQLTRQCLEVLAEFRNPVGIITKNHLVTRDIDILSELSKYDAARVFVSVTTLDHDLARVMEPRTSNPSLRLNAIRQLSEAGVPVGVMMGPIVPGLTDHEIGHVLKACAEAGATSAHYTLLRLPYGVKELFQTWLAAHYPLRKERVLNRLREMRGGKLYNAEFGKRMSGEGPYAQYIAQTFDLWRRKHGLDKPTKPLSAVSFQTNKPEQLKLF